MTDVPKGALPLPKWTGLAIVGTAVVAAFAITMKHGLGAALILLAGGALVLFIWLAFRAVQSVTEPDDASLLLDTAPTPAQTRKQSALRALKDIDAERAVGNLNDDDYAELVEKYRAEAKLAMREVDEERAQLRGRAEALAKRAVERALDSSEEDAGADAEADAKKKPRARSKPKLKADDDAGANANADADANANADADADANACPKCKTKNDPDAAFCKRCGEKMGDA